MSQVHQSAGIVTA